MAKGTLDVIGVKDFDALYTAAHFHPQMSEIYGLMIEFTNVENVAGMLKGDWGYIGNYANVNAGNWNGENIIKLDGADIWGHPFGKTTEAEVTKKLKKEGDAAATKANVEDKGDFSGFTKKTKFTNISKLGMNVFDHRNKKKAP